MTTPPEGPLRNSKHVFRVVLLLAAVIVVLVLGRSLFVPPTWGEHGPYRAAAVTAHRAQEVRHGGDDACGQCHDEQLTVHDDGAHSSVRCELCHGVLSGHVVDGEVVAEMPRAASFELCTRCHRMLNARPADFPQINPAQHLADMGVEEEPDVCVGCHDPHSPGDL